jgi:ATPase subunit of ABC transporter with duplicated ATPase domains
LGIASNFEDLNKLSLHPTSCCKGPLGASLLPAPEQRVIRFPQIGPGREVSTMHVRKIKIEGYRTFRKFELDLNQHLNIIVGDNETGKSTLLEAINLVLSCQIDGRNIQYELNPHIFNSVMVNAYFAALNDLWDIVDYVDKIIEEFWQENLVEKEKRI